MPKFDYDRATKGIVKMINDYAAIQSERSKIMGAMLTNQVKAQQNTLFRQQERGQREQEKTARTEAQQGPLRAMFMQQQGPEGYINPQSGQPDPTITAAGATQGYPQPQPQPFLEPPRTQAVVGKKGLFEAQTPGAKEWVFSRIQEKQRRGFKLNKAEERFRDKYLGVSEKPKKERYLYKLPPTGKGGFLGMGGRNEITQKAFQNIKTQSDIDELLEQREAYEKAGVDVQSILEHYAGEIKR